MKALGIVLLGMGAVCLAAGGIFLVGILRRVADARVVQTVPYQGEKLAPSGPIAVSTDRLCQVRAVFHPDLRVFGNVDVVSLGREYAVSFSVRVLDEAGAVLYQEKGIPWGMTTTANGLTGSLELSVTSSKFAPPASGKLQVDSTYSLRNSANRMKSAELQVYDTVSDHTKPGVYAALFGVTGGAAALLGGGLLFLRLLQRKPGPTTIG